MLLFAPRFLQAVVALYSKLVVASNLELWFEIYVLRVRNEQDM